MKKINVALAGFGSGARFFNAPIIASVEGLEIKMILTSTPANIEAAKVDFPKAKVVNSYKEILQDSSIDLVVIATPNHVHKEQTAKALEAGKHVIVEKPLTPSVQEADELINLAKIHNRILTVNHNRRWASDFLTIKKLLEGKKLGRIVEYEANFNRFRPEIKNNWKQQKTNPGNGLFYDLGSHLIDQSLLLFGPPKEIFANLQIQRDLAQVVDSFELLLFYPQLKVTLKAGMLIKENGPTYSLSGTQGTFLKYGADVQEEALKGGKMIRGDENWGKEPESIWGNLNTVEGKAVVESERGNYRRIYQNLYQAILGNESVEVKAEEAKAVIKVIEVALQSHSEKRIIPFE